jgi:phenylpropionate dioxygenase-like ring-hydroxylating dioxygenase large terminal subunit
MQSELTAGHYTDASILAREHKMLFRRLWLFAGLRSALAGPDAFITRTLGGLPVLLQNCDGEIRAFANQCPHRLMPLQKEEFGQARMRCPYHGWTFDHEGAVKAIPHECSLYQYSDEEKQQLRMRRYAVAEVGNLIFVNLDTDPLPIEKQFSAEVLETARAMSLCMAEQAAHINIDARYNWKLQYENVLDYNHVPYVHPKTFSPLMGKPQATTVQKYESVPDVLMAQSYYRRGPLEIPHYPWHDQVKRYGDGNDFHNLYLFPNVNFTSVGGLEFLVQQYDPIAPDHTQVRFSISLAQGPKRFPNMPAILRGYVRAEVNVLREDMAYMESMQTNLHADSPRARHGAYEQHLISFARVYSRMMEGEKPW